MNAGPLRNRVTLQAATYAVSGDRGQRKATWADVGTYWASIRQVSAKEAVNADRLKATATHFVAMRYVGAVLASTHRLKFGTRVFAIEIANNVDERRREWEIYAVEVKNPA